MLCFLPLPGEQLKYEDPAFLSCAPSGVRCGQNVRHTEVTAKDLADSALRKLKNFIVKPPSAMA